jgi:hypothetical protein
MVVPELVALLSKVIALANYFLGFFVDVGPGAQIITGACGANVNVLDANVNACGQGIMQHLLGLTDVGLLLLNYVFAGILVT